MGMDPQESINSNKPDQMVQGVLDEIQKVRRGEDTDQLNDGGQQPVNNSQSDIGFVTNFLEQANARGMSLEETLNKIEQIVKMENIFTGGGQRQPQQGGRQQSQPQSSGKDLESMNQVTENDVDDLMK
jgi:hypothetical protein